MFHLHTHKAAAAAGRDEQKEPQARRLLALAAAVLPLLSAGFVAAVFQLRRNAASSDISDAIEAGRPADSIIVLLGLGPYSNQPGPFGALRSALRDAIDEAGDKLSAFVPAAVQPAGPPVPATFDRLDTQTVRFVQEYEGALIRQLADDTRAAVRAVLVQPGATAAKKIKALREIIGLTDRQSAAVQSYRAALERGDARNALGRELRDRRHDRSVARVGEKPLSPEQIDRMVAKYRDRMVRHRAETIAKTESVRAVNAANREVWRQAAASGIVAATQVRGFWLVVDDDSLCERCEPIPEMNADGRRLGEMFDTPFDGQAVSGPLHVRCRCVVNYRLVTA